MSNPCYIRISLSPLLSLRIPISKGHFLPLLNKSLAELTTKQRELHLAFASRRYRHKNMLIISILPKAITDCVYKINITDKICRLPPKNAGYL